MSESSRPHEIRMSGFRQRSGVDAAWEWIDRAIEEFQPTTQIVPLEDAHDCRLAETVISEINVPSFDRSAMDGYAVVAEQTNGASSYQPLSLKVIGKSLPGKGFSGHLHHGEAVEIMTGAPIPAGADAVVPAEYAELVDGNVRLSTTVSPSKHIGRTGEDISVGDVVVQAGRRLRPQDIGVLASIGTSEVSVFAKPKVRIIVTGNELVRPGEHREPQQIFEANSFLLRGTVVRDGSEIESVRFVKDQPDEIATAILDPGANVILISGGSSVGAEDHAPSIIHRHGELAIHGIRMRPSSPAGMGTVGDTVVFLQPGNPVSCLCAYDFFAGRYLRGVTGDHRQWPFRTVELPLAKKVASAIGRTDYCRVKIENGKAVPLAISGASILSSTTRADGFLVVPEASEGLPAGKPVSVMLYDDLVHSAGFKLSESDNV